MAAKVKNTRANGEAIWTAELAFGMTLVAPGAPVEVLLPVLDDLELVSLAVDDPLLLVVMEAFDEALVAEGAEELVVPLRVIEANADVNEERTEETEEEAAADSDERAEEIEETAEEAEEAAAEVPDAVAPSINWN